MDYMPHLSTGQPQSRAACYHHDHDEELGMYWYPPPNASVTASTEAVRDQPRPRDLMYWIETGSLVNEYLILQAGAAYSETLRQKFVQWLQHVPAERRRYVDGDDMQRAALVDWFLRFVR